MPQIKGDVGGLHDISTQISKAKEPLTYGAKAINSTVDALVGDAGWHGEAASKFRGAWKRDSTVMASAADLISTVAGAASDLAHGLSAARSHLYNAQDVAERAGVKFTSDGDPDPSVHLSGSAAQALKTYQGAAEHAQQMAKDARDAAKKALYTVLVRTNPKLPGGGDMLLAQDDLAQAALVHDYVYLPGDMARRQLQTEIDAFPDYYKKLRAQFRSAKAGSPLRAELKSQMAEARRAVNAAHASLAEVDAYEATMMRGRYFNKSAGDLLAKLGKDSKWIRIADQVPLLDVAAATVGTYAQAKYDHERGWGWTHAVVADGSANVTGMATEVVAAETGPVAPVLGYGVTSLVNEYTHTVPWTQNIHDHGWVAGLGRSVVQGGVETGKTDFYEAGKKIGQSAMHPGGTAKKLWNGVGGNGVDKLFHHLL
jgi:hypothetical protein